jgi:hypothetical protein
MTERQRLDATGITGTRNSAAHRAWPTRTAYAATSTDSALFCLLSNRFYAFDDSQVRGNAYPPDKSSPDTIVLHLLPICHDGGLGSTNPYVIAPRVISALRRLQARQRQARDPFLQISRIEGEHPLTGRPL